MNNVKTIVFRVDAFVSIGVGHVMRCLTLTDILSCKGAECHFLTRNWDGNITEFISVRGYHLHLLPRPIGCDSKKEHNNVKWLGVSVEQDIRDCWPILSQLRAQWCVIDL